MDSPRRFVKRALYDPQPGALTLAFLLALTVFVPGTGSAHAADLVPLSTSASCKPAFPQPGSSCSKDTQCCAGLVCQTGACRPGCRVGGVLYAAGALKPANACQICQPSTSTSAFTNVTNGASCSDGNACTQTDTCQAGVCTGASPVTCSAQDQCHLAGTCNHSSGLCSNPSKPNGTTCSDANACTRTDACQAGVCRGANPVACTAMDSCHSAGTCNPATGACSNPVKADGTPCSDGNACTRRDTCQSGACTGSSPVICQSSEQCRDPGTCNPASGTCSSPNKPDGTLCTDGNACTTDDRCQGGACAGTSVTCSPGDACHDAGTCNAQTGACVSPPKPDGTACTDGDACTTVDTCAGGVCQGGVPRICQGQQACHTPETCDHTTGQCVSSPLPDGTLCFDFNACTSDACLAGSCHGTPVTCTASDDCHEAGSCDPISGRCSNPPKPDGAACNDGSACTLSDVCQAGVCTGTNSVACDSLPATQCHDAAGCNPTNGQCGVEVRPNGTACDDGNACTTSDGCRAGVCVGQGCGAGQTCCTTGCVDLHANSANCGSCGNACQNGSICFQGSCFDGCLISGVAYRSGALNGSNVCQMCDPAFNRTAWKPRGDFPHDTISCADGCYSGFCAQGACVVTSPGGGCPATECSTSICNQNGICVTTPIVENEGDPCTPPSSLSPCRSLITGTCQSGQCVPSFANEGSHCAVTQPINNHALQDRDCYSRVDGHCASGSCAPNIVPADSVCEWYTEDGQHTCIYGTCYAGVYGQQCNLLPNTVACSVPNGCGVHGTCNPSNGQCGDYPGYPWPGGALLCGTVFTGPNPQACCPGMICDCPPVPVGNPSGFCVQYSCYNPTDFPY